MSQCGAPEQRLAVNKGAHEAFSRAPATGVSPEGEGRHTRREPVRVTGFPTARHLALGFPSHSEGKRFADLKDVASRCGDCGGFPPLKDVASVGIF